MWVELHGAPIDNNKKKTQHVDNNGNHFGYSSCFYMVSNSHTVNIVAIDDCEKWLKALNNQGVVTDEW